MKNDCLQVQEFIPWLVNGTLNSQEKVFVFQHIVTCKHCKHELAFFLELNKTVEKLAVIEELNEQVAIDLFSKISNQIKSDQLAGINESSNQLQLKNAIELNPFDVVFQVFKTLSTSYRDELSKLTKSLEPIVKQF